MSSPQQIETLCRSLLREGNSLCRVEAITGKEPGEYILNPGSVVHMDREHQLCFMNNGDGAAALHTTYEGDKWLIIYGTPAPDVVVKALEGGAAAGCVTMGRVLKPQMKSVLDMRRDLTEGMDPVALEFINGVHSKPWLYDATASPWNFTCEAVDQLIAELDGICEEAEAEGAPMIHLRVDLDPESGFVLIGEATRLKDPITLDGWEHRWFKTGWNSWFIPSSGLSSLELAVLAAAMPCHANDKNGVLRLHARWRPTAIVRQATPPEELGFGIVPKDGMPFSFKAMKGLQTAFSPEGNMDEAGSEKIRRIAEDKDRKGVSVCVVICNDTADNPVTHMATLQGLNSAHVMVSKGVLVAGSSEVEPEVAINHFWCRTPDGKHILYPDPEGGLEELMGPTGPVLEMLSDKTHVLDRLSEGLSDRCFIRRLSDNIMVLVLPLHAGLDAHIDPIALFHEAWVAPRFSAVGEPGEKDEISLANGSVEIGHFAALLPDMLCR